MRDYLLILVLPLLLYAAMRRPYLSLSFWIWSALVPPYLWAFGGMSTSVRWNFLFAIVTLASFAINKINKKPPDSAIFVLAIIFFVHASVSSFLNTNLSLGSSSSRVIVVSSCDGERKVVYDRENQNSKASLFQK